MSPEEIERRIMAKEDADAEERVTRPARLRQERRAQDWGFLFGLLGLAGFIYMIVMVLHL